MLVCASQAWIDSVSQAIATAGLQEDVVALARCRFSKRLELAEQLGCICSASNATAASWCIGPTEIERPVQGGEGEGAWLSCCVESVFTRARHAAAFTRNLGHVHSHFRCREVGLCQYQTSVLEVFLETTKPSLDVTVRRKLSYQFRPEAYVVHQSFGRHRTDWIYIVSGSMFSTTEVPNRRPFGVGFPPLEWKLTM